MTHQAQEELQARLREIRGRLERGFGSRSAAPGFPGSIPSSGQCAAAAIVARQLLGGNFASAEVNGHSHWFNRVMIGSEVLDIDLTGDQFGYGEVQFGPADSLYEGTRVRAEEDVTKETVHRAIELAKGAGLHGVATRLRQPPGSIP